MTIEDAIASNIRAWRARRSIQQAELAAGMQELGFTTWLRQTVGGVEQAKRRVTASELFGLAQILGCAPASLLDLPDLPAVEFPNGKPVSQRVTG